MAAAGAVTGTMLVAAPQASAAIVTTPISPYTIWYQGATGNIGESAPGGNSTSTIPIEADTSPSGAVTPSSFQYVWQGTNQDLITTGPHGTVDTGLFMEAGTSPDLLTFPDGTWLAAVHGGDSYLHTTGPSGNKLVGIRVSPGTGPGIAATPAVDFNGNPIADAYTIAVQGINNDLWVSTPANGNFHDTGYAMMPRTSPSITRLTNSAAVSNFFISFHGANGDLWTLNSAIGATANDWTNQPMAPGTSPSVATVAAGGVPYYVTAFEGANGHLWMQGGGGDTGLPMAAGTNPDAIITPVDEPGAPLGGLAAYAAYVSNAGIVSLYGFNFTDDSTFANTTGQAAADGAGPGIVSNLNWVDGSTVVNPETVRTAAPSAADTGTVPLNLPSKPTIKPDTTPAVMSDTCPTVRAHLKQYAARGIKQVSCETTTRATPSTLTHAGTRAVTPDIAGSTLCGSATNVWVSDRTEECIQGYDSHWTTFNSDGQMVGFSDFIISQDVNLATNSTQITEKDTITYADAEGSDVTPGSLTFTATCGSPCVVQGGGSTTFPFAVNQTQNLTFIYRDAPGTQTPDTFNLTYSVLSVIPGIANTTGPHPYNAGEPIRCDNQFPGNMGAGCVIPTFAPLLVLPLSVYGAAAMNVYVGEHYLPGTPGLSDATPLTRGNPNSTTANRNVTCAGFQPFADPNPDVTMDSCDEYPFASTKQSGGALGIAGSNCLEILPEDTSGGGDWGWFDLTKYTFQFPQACLRGHVNQTLNSNVGTMALNPMYTNNRMLVGDPFTVQVTD